MRFLPMLLAIARFAAPVVMMLGLAACGGGQMLSSGLTARMDAPGAQLNRAEALSIVNHYRATVGAGALTEDSALDATAQQFAASYAKTGRQSPKPDGTIEVRYSAGYATF